MSAAEEPARKPDDADTEILSALQGVKCEQSRIRAALKHGGGEGVFLNPFRTYYNRLPEAVARRLTEIDPEAVNRITAVAWFNASGEKLKQFAEELASDAAFAQVIRAANIYRERLGYGPLGPDGWPQKSEQEETTT